MTHFHWLVLSFRNIFQFIHCYILSMSVIISYSWTSFPKTEVNMTDQHRCFQDLKSFLLQGLFPKRFSTSATMDSDNFGRTCGMRRDKGLRSFLKLFVCMKQHYMLRVSQRTESTTGNSHCEVTIGRLNKCKTTFKLWSDLLKNCHI